MGFARVGSGVFWDLVGNLSAGWKAWGGVTGGHVMHVRDFRRILQHGECFYGLWDDYVVD